MRVAFASGGDFQLLSQSGKALCTLGMVPGTVQGSQSLSSTQVSPVLWDLLRFTWLLPLKVNEKETADNEDSEYFHFSSMMIHFISSIPPEEEISPLFLGSGCFAPIVSIEDRFLKYIFFSLYLSPHRISA